MSTLSYLDIHSHRKASSDLGEVVANLSQEEILEESAKHTLISAGIHPWWIQELKAEEIEQLKGHILNLLSERRLWGLGETGIDRVYPEFLELQKELFFWHWELAEAHQLPLIIHSVRAGSDFLEILKKKKSNVPWIFHDFRGNEDLMKNLLRLHSQCFFSFGLSLDNSPQVRELLPLIPFENIFLETDNQKHLDIHDIYLRAAEVLKVDMDFLKCQIWHNFKKITPSRH